MELAVQAAQSRHLPDFLERFAERAARRLNATWGGVAVGTAGSPARMYEIRSLTCVSEMTAPQTGM